MQHRSSWNYFGVRIIKQIIVEGDPDPPRLDEYYEDDGKQMFEENLMLVHAQSADHAYKIAEKRLLRANTPAGIHMGRWLHGS